MATNAPLEPILNCVFLCTRHIELDLASRAKDDQLVKLRDSAKNKQRHLEETCETLRTELGEAEVTRRQLEWTISDLNNEKEVTVERWGHTTQNSLFRSVRPGDPTLRFLGVAIIRTALCNIHGG